MKEWIENEGTKYVFHYTNEDVAINAFKGDKPQDALLVEINRVIVLDRQSSPDLTFHQCPEDPDDWVIPREEIGEIIEMDAVIAGSATWDGTEWEKIDKWL